MKRSLAFLTLSVAAFLLLAPVLVALLGATQPSEVIARGSMAWLPGGETARNLGEALTQGAGTAPVWRLLLNSAVMAAGIAAGKIVLSLLSAFALVYFRVRGRGIAFALIFLTLLLPVEVRIVPTYDVVVKMGLSDSMGGLILPLLASATGTLLLRQFMRDLPRELVDAARIDGAGPLAFFWHILLPLSRTSVAALGVVLFVYGWNQYLWPLLIVTRAELDTVIVAVVKMIGTGEAMSDWGAIMAAAILALLPPVIVVLALQRLFVRGLISAEK
ncbi:sn-glycerol-3-phosphate ABC transporter permease UgpE [Roseococcus pinisoli]|uniref:sn-glycerol-3-phosphate transport system permease protein UgpE n=1 Tax=Roseococcus pinisoli TaxID=2835040 RepID=A0ABS5QKV2_9PROT|nr:sn-glycerol-3-phosphate ABC transporter permease UgpE [Roseococcus pinisoli]MBS7813680.1 sn-glycerol-3-phosphate ABC transporter permease UgpE [Roseococcus pinisoli]